MLLRGFLALTALLIGAVVLNAAVAQQGGTAQAENTGPDAGAAGAAFAVDGIRLDVRASTVEQARHAAFREAPRRAWPILWSRMTGRAQDDAPAMTDAALDAMIDAIEVETERFGDGRYIATLGVVFERGRAGRRLPLGARLLQSRPLLLIPLLTDAGASATLDPNSAWYAAWQEFGAGASLIDYVRPQGAAGDRVLLGSWQSLRDDRALWRSVLTRYDADNVLVAEARLVRSYPGGPVIGLFLARYGPDSRILENFELRANGTADVPKMLQTAIKRIDAIYTKALQDGTLQADDALSVALAPIEAPAGQIDDGYEPGQSLTATVVTPTVDAWTRVNGILSQVPQIDQATLETLNIGGTSIARIGFEGSFAQLRYALDRRGLRLEPGESGYRLRARLEGEVPLPPPAPQAAPVATGDGATINIPTPAPAPVPGAAEEASEPSQAEDEQ